MRRGHRRISDVHRLAQRSLGNSRLYFGSFRVLALPLLFDAAECLSRRFAKHFHDVVLRHLLRRMFEENEMVLVACDDGALGQSAWRLFAWFSCCRGFLRHGLAQAGLGKSQNLWLRRSWLLHCNIHQSSWLAYLRRRSCYARPLRASEHHRVAVLLSEYNGARESAGEHSRHHLHLDIYR